MKFSSHGTGARRLTSGASSARVSSLRAQTSRGVCTWPKEGEGALRGPFYPIPERSTAWPNHSKGLPSNLSHWGLSFNLRILWETQTSSLLHPFIDSGRSSFSCVNCCGCAGSSLVPQSLLPAVVASTLSEWESEAWRKIPKTIVEHFERKYSLNITLLKVLDDSQDDGV